MIYHVTMLGGSKGARIIFFRKRRRRRLAVVDGGGSNGQEFSVIYTVQLTNE